MRLLSKFRHQINELQKHSPIRQAWFTSFNLSPHFVETYILQAIAGQNEKLSSVADYEVLQQRLLEQNIDIRFFSDAAAIDSSEPKRTSFNFHMINPRQLDAKYAKGVFHPKVIFLRTEDGVAVVGAGSANLTMSGWGRNREVFQFKRINDTNNSERVLDFFKILFQHFDIDFPEINIKTQNTGESVLAPDWLFLSSLNDDRLFDHLKDQEGEALSVWSPYFSEDLVGFKRNHIDPAFNRKVRLVVYPDIVTQNNLEQVRIPDTPENRMKLSECEDIVFRKMLYDDADIPIAMTHAKIWHVGRRMAIGSWNCTQAGTNVHLEDTSAGNNVEAGILLMNETPEGLESEEILKEKCLMPADQLKEEQEDLPKDQERLPFFIAVCFDWQSRSYKVSVKDVPVNEDWRLSLPGKKKTVSIESLKDEKTIIKEVDIKPLLTHRTYTIENIDKQQKYFGLIIEKGVMERPPHQFESLVDLFDAWNDGRPQKNTAAHTLRAASGSEGLEEIGGEIAHAESDHPDYFRMFRAFQNMRDKLDQENDEDELRRLIQVYPGCLMETGEKIRAILQQSEFSQVFRWMLKMEYQTLLQKARDCAGTSEKIDWKALSMKDQDVRIDNTDKRILDLVIKLGKYDRSAV
ncbi:MAG: hypothetical protein ACOZF0_21715 [Thermodesulfobacteriota bacterium]